jgi:hypothetical protein
MVEGVKITVAEGAVDVTASDLVKCAPLIVEVEVEDVLQRSTDQRDLEKLSIEETTDEDALSYDEVVTQGDANKVEMAVEGPSGPSESESVSESEYTKEATTCPEGRADSSVDSAHTPEPTEEVPAIYIGGWAHKAMEDFGLNALPSNWSNPDLLEQCSLKDEKLWKRYHESRRLLVDECSDPVDEKKEDSGDTTPQYKDELKNEFHAEWRSTILGAVLLKNTYQRAAGVEKKDSKLQQATIVSTIFSPYLLPRAVQLCHRYRHQGEKFWCTWHIQFVSLKEDNEDLMSYWKPHMKDMWELCSNGSLEMPTNELEFMEVQDIETSYFTPNMVRKIRKWLFGHSHSYHLFNDMDLLRYVFGSCGAVHNYTTLYGDVGHTWKARPEQSKDMQIYGTLKDSEVKGATKYGTNWLEFQCRLSTGSLRAIDQWYEPYDQNYYKGVWGTKVMDHRYKEHGYYEEDDDVRVRPWVVWDRSVCGVHTDQSMQNNVMSYIGNL